MVNPIRNPMIQIFAAHREIAGLSQHFPHIFHICFPYSHVNPNKQHIFLNLSIPKSLSIIPKSLRKKPYWVPKFSAFLPHVELPTSPFRFGLRVLQLHPLPFLLGRVELCPLAAQGVLPAAKGWMRPGGALTLAVYSGFSADINSGSSLGELGTWKKWYIYIL